MCVGVPLQVISVQGLTAVCAAADGPVTVDTALLEAVTPGEHLLIHLGVAIRKLDPQEARDIADALEAVRRAAAGEPFDHLFADLIGREPQLPEHLRPKHTNTEDHR